MVLYFTVPQAFRAGPRRQLLGQRIPSNEIEFNGKFHLLVNGSKSVALLFWQLTTNAIKPTCDFAIFAPHCGCCAPPSSAGIGGGALSAPRSWGNSRTGRRRSPENRKIFCLFIKPKVPLHSQNYFCAAARDTHLGTDESGPAHGKYVLKDALGGRYEEDQVGDAEQRNKDEQGLRGLVVLSRLHRVGRAEFRYEHLWNAINSSTSESFEFCSSVLTHMMRIRNMRLIISTPHVGPWYTQSIDVSFIHVQWISSWNHKVVKQTPWNS